jgi:hypothetical protein
LRRRAYDRPATDAGRASRSGNQARLGDQCSAAAPGVGMLSHIAAPDSRFSRQPMVRR